MERKRFKLTDDNSMDGCIFPDGTTNYSVLDLIAIYHKHTSDEYAHAKLVWSKFKKDPRYTNELARLVKYDTDYYRMSPALRMNPMMSIDGLKRLLAILPRTHRMDPRTHTLHRETLSATLTRFIDGDKSMVEDWGSKLDARLALTLSNIEASAEIGSGAANAASSVKINATAVIGEIPASDKSASSAACAETVSIVKPEYVLGQRALNSANDHTLRRDCRRATVEKTAVPSRAMSPLSAWSAKIDAMDTGMPSRASSSCSDFSTASVADSVEFTETNPEALRGLVIDAIEQEALGDTTMIDSADMSEILMSNEPVDEVLPRPVRQKMAALQLTFPITEAVPSAASRMQVLDIHAHDVLLRHLS